MWRQDLLALDRRQRLLYFKHTKSASLEIGTPTGIDLLELVTEGEAPRTRRHGCRGTASSGRCHHGGGTRLPTR
ncbi:hypothetical protein GS923_00020 [Rhodococcus hoagii]|nr:hypothetical protein [Prescottella equi]